MESMGARFIAGNHQRRQRLRAVDETSGGDRQHGSVLCTRAMTWMVHGLLQAAVIVALYALVVYGALLARRAPASERALLVALVVMELPMSAAAFHGVRVPLDGLVRQWLGAGHPAYPWVAILYAPLTEEPAKLLPLALPWVMRRVNDRNADRAAWALGLGFGVGEALFLAALLWERVPSMPWYAYGGFMAERFMVALVHGLTVRAALRAWTATPPQRARGVATAMAMHLALNLPILLAALGWFGSDRGRIAAGLTAWVALWWGAAFARLTMRWDAEA
mgnify:CR=1 FL=1